MKNLEELIMNLDDNWLLAFSVMQLLIGIWQLADGGSFLWVLIIGLAALSITLNILRRYLQ